MRVFVVAAASRQRAMFEMPAQCAPTRMYIRVLRQSQALSTPLRVLRTIQSIGDVDRKNRAVDANQAKIEQGMQISSQEQPIGDNVGVQSLVRVDVYGFQDFDDAATRYRAARSVCTEKGVAKSGLTSSPHDRTKNPLARIFHIRRIELTCTVGFSGRCHQLT
jgi:hypothetical protein